MYYLAHPKSLYSHYNYHGLWGFFKTKDSQDNLGDKITELESNELKRYSIKTQIESMHKASFFKRGLYWLFNINNYRSHSYLYASYLSHRLFQKTGKYFFRKNELIAALQDEGLRKSQIPLKTLKQLSKHRFVYEANQASKENETMTAFAFPHQKVSIYHQARNLMDNIHFEEGMAYRLNPYKTLIDRSLIKDDYHRLIYSAILEPYQKAFLKLPRWLSFLQGISAFKVKTIEPSYLLINAYMHLIYNSESRPSKQDLNLLNHLIHIEVSTFFFWGDIKAPSKNHPLRNVYQSMDITDEGEAYELEVPSRYKPLFSVEHGDFSPKEALARDSSDSPKPHQAMANRGNRHTRLSQCQHSLFNQEPEPIEASTANHSPTLKTN